MAATEIFLQRPAPLDRAKESIDQLEAKRNNMLRLFDLHNGANGSPYTYTSYNGTNTALNKGKTIDDYKQSYEDAQKEYKALVEKSRIRTVSEDEKKAVKFKIELAATDYGQAQRNGVSGSSYSVGNTYYTGIGSENLSQKPKYGIFSDNNTSASSNINTSGKIAGAGPQYREQSSGITPEQERIRHIIFNTVNNEPLTNLGSGVNMDFTSMFDTGQPDEVKRETLIRNVFKTLNENKQRECGGTAKIGNSEGATQSASTSFDKKKLSDISNSKVDGDESDKDKSSEAWDYLRKSGKQVLLGNYTDDVTLLGTAGQVALGALGLDLPADIRDLTYDLSNWEWSWAHAGQTALDAIGLLPVIGAVKYADEAAALAKGITKYGDEAVEVADDILKNADEIEKIYNSSKKAADAIPDGLGKNAAQAADAAEDAAWYADKVANPAKGTAKSADNTKNTYESFQKAYEASKGAGKTKLYRVMSDAEYQSTTKNGGKFRKYANSMEEKWFAVSPEDAVKWGDKFYPDGQYKMIEIAVPTDSLRQMYHVEKLDGIGSAYCGGIDFINSIMKGLRLR